MIALGRRAHPTLSLSLRAAYCRLVEERVGLRLSEQQLHGLDAAVAATLAMGHGSQTAESLYESFALGGQGALFDAFAARLTIGETHFFRVGPQIAALRGMVLPDLIARRAEQRRLAIWSAGCSSGEEPYTLAILLRELLPEPESWEVALLATDLSEPALDEARQARYGEWSFRETPERIRRQYFVQGGGPGNCASRCAGWSASSGSTWSPTRSPRRASRSPRST